MFRQYTMGRKRSREIWKTYNDVFDNFTIGNLETLSAQGHYDEIITSLAQGKEAHVFLARTKDDDIVAIKIYRLQNCDFNKMYHYISQDPRYNVPRGSKRRIIFEWTRREYRNLQKARECITVPTPYVLKHNIIVMQYIMDGEHPAPKLKDADIEDPQQLYEDVLEQMKRLFEQGIIHGDLSGFNILLSHGQPIFIDFSQSTTTRSLHAKELLERDISNIQSFFKRKGVNVDEQEMYEYITSSTRQGE